MLLAESDSSGPVRVVRIYSAYRRSLLYCAIGGWLCLLLAAALPRGPLDPVGVTLGVLLVGVLPSAVWLIATIYRVRIDEHGISRRRLGIWTLWPWEDFQAGRVRLNEKDGWLSNSGRTLWDRWWLGLPFLEPDEVNFVMELVRGQCPAKSVATDPAVVDVSEVELIQLFFRHLVISRDGCLWKRSGELILWSEIANLRIERRRVKSQDMYHLQWVTQGQKLQGPVNQIRQSGMWISPRQDEDEIWIAQLRQLVPPEKFTYVRSHGELRSLEEGEYRLKNLADQTWAMWWFEAFSWGFLVASYLFFGPKLLGWWNMPFLALGWRIAGVALLLLNALMPGTLLIILCRYIHRDALGRKAIVKQEMAALASREANSEVKLPPHSRFTRHATAS